MSTTTAVQIYVNRVRREQDVPVSSRDRDATRPAHVARETVRALPPHAHPANWPPLMGFGRAVRVERENRGWSLTELAANVCLSPQDLHDIEAGEVDPTFCTMCDIAHKLRLRPARLVDLGEDETTWLLDGIPF